MWFPIKDAPKDTPLVVMTRDIQTVVAIFAPFDGGSYAWQAWREDEHPKCWTDGVCWGANENQEPSDPPKWWTHMPDGYSD